MDMSPFALTLLAVAIPIVAVLLAAAWFGYRGSGRVRLVDRTGRVIAQVVLGRTGDGD